jgi:hypothetical protein
MTTHETDRRDDIDAVAENEETGGRGDPMDEQYDHGPDTDADAAEPVMQEPVEDEPETAWSREHDAVDEGTDRDEDAEPVLVDTDEADELATPELADESDSVDAGAVDPAPESDALQRLAPVDPDAALDPGTGSYQDRWGAIQAGFIDEPRRTVESASALLTEIWDETVRVITNEREGVEARWQSTETSTDDLRVAMQDYRALYARYIRFTSD